jgi:hypothetical protein
MARRVTAGVTGGASIAGLQAVSTTLTSAENLDIIVDPIGTGRFLINGNAQLQGRSDLRFADADSSNWVAFEAPETVATNITWTLPSADGTSNQILTTNGSGLLSWSDKTIGISDQTVSATTHYITLTTATSGTVTSVNTSSTKISFQPSTGNLTVSGTIDVGGSATITGLSSARDYKIGLTVSGSNTIALDFSSGDGVITRAATGTVTFTGANYQTGTAKTVRIIAGAAQRTLEFPSGWVFVGGSGKPDNIPAGFTGILSVTSFGTIEADCVAAFVI